MPQYRLDLSYIGSAFQGWQSQTQGRSVQQALEKALGIITRQECKVIGASRTDSGVHAEGQVACFFSDRALDCERLPESLNALTPSELAVYKAEQVGEEFHPIRDAQGKAYRYILWRGRRVSPFWAPYVWPIHKDLDLVCLRQEAMAFKGTHDFRSFCATDSGAKTFERHIYDIQVLECGPLVMIWVMGRGFLKQMVRAMVGTLVQLAQKPGPPIAEVLAACDRRAAGITAPAQGLSLVKVFYEAIPESYEIIKASQSTFATVCRGDATKSLA